MGKHGLKELVSRWAPFVQLNAGAVKGILLTPEQS